MIIGKFPVITKNNENKVVVIVGRLFVDIKIFIRKYKIPFTRRYLPLFKKVEERNYWLRVLREDYDYDIKSLIIAEVKAYEEGLIERKRLNNAKQKGIKEFKNWDGVVPE